MIKFLQVVFLKSWYKMTQNTVHCKISTYSQSYMRYFNFLITHT